jgi:hypothetical protein
MRLNGQIFEVGRATDHVIARGLTILTAP